MSREIMGLLVACQNARVVSQTKGTVNRENEDRAVIILWPRVFDSLCCVSQRRGHWTTHKRSRRERGTITHAFSVHRLSFRVNGQDFTRKWQLAISLHSSLLFISSAPLNYL